MLSIFIFLVVLVVSFVATAWSIALAARSVGSRRARFRNGVVASLLILAINVAWVIIGVVGDRFAEDAPSAVFLSVALLGTQLFCDFLVLQRVFLLSGKRALAPLGAIVAVTILQLAFAFLILRPLLFEAFVMPTESMSPTIDTGDRFVVNKLLQPRRWDLVAYWNVDSHDKSVYVKRVIGLPGERLRFENGNLYVNDQPVTSPPVLAGRLRAVPEQAPQASQRYRDGDTFVLGPDEYFYIGDNVDVSLDSRLLGPSHASSLVGVVDVMYWPPRKVHVFR